MQTPEDQSPPLIPELTEPAKIGDNLTIDVLIDREPSFDSDVTENPVEDGFPVADHVIRNPIKLSLNAVFTPTPVTWLDYIGGEPNPARLADVMQALQDIYQKAEPITVTLPDAIYRDMVMTSCKLPRNLSDGYCLKVPLEFVHVRKVSQRQEDIPKEYTANDAAGKAGTTEADAGTAEQTEIGTGMTVVKPPETPAKAQSAGTIDTGGVGYNNAGNMSPGMEQTAVSAAEALQAAMMG